MFFLTLQLIFAKLPVFGLVLFRVAGLMALAPLFGAMTIPVRIKAFAALAIAIVVFPSVPPVGFVPTSLLALTFGVASEMLIGITMGFAVSLTFLGVQIGAELVSHQMGLSMARMVDPTTQVQTTVLSQLYMMIGTVIYLLINGHLVLIRSLVDTFQTVPLMGAVEGLTTRATDSGNYYLIMFFTSVVKESFILGIRVAGPTLIAIFLATLALGFISRTMPQLNILAAGFPIRITLALLLLVSSLGAFGILFKQQLVFILEAIGGIFLYGLP